MCEQREPQLDEQQLGIPTWKRMDAQIPTASTSDQPLLFLPCPFVELHKTLVYAIVCILHISLLLLIIIFRDIVEADT